MIDKIIRDMKIVGPNRSIPATEEVVIKVAIEVIREIIRLATDDLKEKADEIIEDIRKL